MSTIEEKEPKWGLTYKKIFLIIFLYLSSTVFNKQQQQHLTTLQSDYSEKCKSYIE